MEPVLVFSPYPVVRVAASNARTYRLLELLQFLRICSGDLLGVIIGGRVIV